MRTLALGIVVMMGAVGCSMFGGSGSGDAGRGLRSFYLTKDVFQGNQALSVCARGYHMASRFELWDVSLLRYDRRLGFVTDDSGSGPPSQAAPYGSPGAAGWIRTGGSSAFTDPANAPGSAFTNCATWSTNSGQSYGTVAYLNDKFTTDGHSAAPLWNGGSQHCDVANRVWCVGDARAAESTEPSFTPHRRRGFEGP